MAEDREEFPHLMNRLGEPVPESWVIEGVGQLRELSSATAFRGRS
jgi:carbamoylphosphate synthase large subunit